VRPYYEDDAVTIYHGDCRDVLPSISSTEIVITDPPYGIAYQSTWRTDWNRKAPIEGDREFPLWLFDVVAPSVALFVWCRWDVLPILPAPKSYIVWDKGAHSMGDLKHEYGRRWEGCAFWPGPSHSFMKRPADVIVCRRVPSERSLHPAEKPVGAITPLIIAHVGDILDPFMGSGTTLRAAKDLGRKAIGIEIEERYCEIAAKRMSQTVMAL